MSRLAVVTGAARGIGRAIAVHLHRDGWRLLLVDRDPLVRASASELGVDHCACVEDLMEPASVQRIASDIDLMGVPLRGLVNNASITRDASLRKMAAEDFRDVVRLNLVATARLCERLKPMFDANASIVNVASRSAFGSAGQFNYSVAKAGVLGLTRSLGRSWSPQVRVNAVAPGLIDTEMTRSMPADILQSLQARIPAGRLGQPEEIAKLVTFLLSDKASYVTGQSWLVCGGRSISG